MFCRCSVGVLPLSREEFARSRTTRANTTEVRDGTRSPAAWREMQGTDEGASTVAAWQGTMGAWEFDFWSE